MGYDMWRHGVAYDDRNRDRDYFRLNVWGMSEAREWLDKFGLLADAEHSAWPATPDDSWPEEGDVEPGSAWDDYYAAHNRILAEHPNRDDPALPYIATHPWSSAGFVACAVATVLLLADLGRDMTVLCSVVAAVVAGVVVVIGRKERARPVGRVVVSFEADTTAFVAAMERASTAADAVVPQQRQGGTS